MTQILIDVLLQATDLLKTKAAGKKISITTKVDPAILGGITLQIGNNFLDLSVKASIEKYVLSLTTA